THHSSLITHHYHSSLITHHSSLITTITIMLPTSNTAAHRTAYRDGMRPHHHHHDANQQHRRAPHRASRWQRDWQRRHPPAHLHRALERGKEELGRVGHVEGAGTVSARRVAARFQGE